RSPGKGHLARMAAEVGGAEGEEEMRHAAAEKEGDQHRRVSELQAGEVQRASGVPLQTRGELGEARIHHRARLATGLAGSRAAGSIPASGRRRPEWSSPRRRSPRATR